MNRDSRIKVMHVVPCLLPGGGERVAVHILRKTDRTTFDVCLVSMLGPRQTDLEKMLEDSGVPVFYMNKRVGPDPRAFLRAYRIIGELRPDVVHTHMHVIPYILPALMMGRIPVCVHTVHNVADKEATGLNRRIQSFAFQRGVVPVAIAVEVAATIKKIYGIGTFPVIPNGIPVSEYASAEQSSETWRGLHGFATEDLIYVCVASLSPPKGHALLLQAFASGPALEENAHLVLAGDGPLRESLTQLARELKIGGKVHFLGRSTDVPTILGSADVFVLASRYKGNPLCVMEAMAAGKPVVATAVGGIPELVQDGESGILCYSQDSNEFSRAMYRLGKDADLRREMGRAARSRALDMFDDRTMADRYKELYLDCLARRNGSLVGAL